MKTKRRWVRALAGALATAVPAAGAVGEVLASFPAPAINPEALAWGNGSLYVFCYTPPFFIYKLNPANGQVLATYPTTPTGSETCGLGYDGVYFWAGDRETDYIYRFKTNGSVVSSFHATWDVGQGLTFTGFHLWCTTPAVMGTYTFVQARPDGSVVNSFMYFDYPYQPAPDNAYIWVGVKDSYLDEYQVMALKQSQGSYVTYFDPPADQPSGAVYDGQYLWLSTIPNNGWIWKVNIAGVAVEPQSLGRVKALFR